MKELRKRKQYLSEFGVLKYFCDILEALTHLSVNGYIHRDIKPENIFITPENVCILGDFGLSSVITDKLDGGNILYKPPEAYYKNEYYKNSEIWSLGLILYELSTNQSLNEFLEKKVSNLEIMLTKKDYLPKNYPKHLEKIKDLVDKCLVIDHEKRATIEELKKEPLIEQYMKGI